LDTSLYEDINGYAAVHDGVAHVAELLAIDAIFLFVAVLAFLALAPERWTGGQGRPAVLTAGLSATVALIVAQVISHIAERPRPFLALPDNSHVLVDSSHDFTFPSDHATAGFAVAVAIAMRMPRLGAALVVLAAAISVSRVAVGVHYPGDVLAGAALGSACAILFSLPPIRARIDTVENWFVDALGGARSRLNH
jgi:undecaprenyl-diphosphatase